MKRRKISINEMEDYEPTPAQEARIEKAIAASEKEDQECRVNFRWQKDPLSMVKQAAELAGMPYQLYIKKVLLEKAKSDLAIAQAQTVNYYRDASGFVGTNVIMASSISRVELGATHNPIPAWVRQKILGGLTINGALSARVFPEDPQEEILNELEQFIIQKRGKKTKVTSTLTFDSFTTVESGEYGCVMQNHDMRVNEKDEL